MPPLPPVPSGRRPVRRRIAVLILAALVVSTAAVVTRIRAFDRAVRTYPTVSTSRFAFAGQAAYAVGDGPVHLSTGANHAAAIASMAKVMTALVILRHLPLDPDRDGPSVTVSAADVRDTERRRDRDESLVPVEQGERLTERQALMAIMLPSANNVAVMATRFVYPSVHDFVADMNEAAGQLGMDHTRYTDPSGYEASTTSTAGDQLLLARAAGANRALSTIAATRDYDLPVAGRIRNTDTLLGGGTFLGLKTGSHEAAGGCFMFHARRLLDGRHVDVWGVVMGQRGRDLVTAALRAGEQLVARDSARGDARRRGQPRPERRRYQHRATETHPEQGAETVAHDVGRGPDPVPPDQVSGLFEPFRRLAGDRLAQTDGAGLGLTIVRSIVGAHHGHLDARADPGGGLTVVVTLPGAGRQTPAAG